MTATTAIRALADKRDFMRVPEVAHLCAGGETAMLHSHLEALARFLAGKSNGQGGRETETMGLLERTRASSAALFGVAAADIAFLSSASEGINQLANAVDWQPGDNVVVEDIEFPSGIYVWARLQQQGVELRVVNQWGSEATLARLADAVDARTRVVHTSQVSYLTGRRYRLEDLAGVTSEVGALLAIDATHAAGVIPVAAQHADLVVSSCYKFLLAVHGAAIFYRNPATLGNLEPRSIGWHSISGEHSVTDPTAYTLASAASRFEAGNPPFISLAVLDNALAYLEALGPERIEQHVLALGGYLWDALAERGIPLLTPRDPAQRGPNVCFRWDDPAALVAQMAARDILIWGDSGRVRISFHVYNDTDDIDRFLEEFDQLR
ncbi:MAG: hypothetical protein DCC58_15375 [Chloroflexi bacterium]|nr:MAG: hypothetical protein DCC58_15375 [Chloroflexota bacterium]